MKRAIAMAAGLALAGVSPLFGCTADLTDGCVAGPCNEDASVVMPVTPPCDEIAAWQPVDKCDVASFPSTGDIPCDVWAVLQRQSGGCFGCHQDPPINSAPFPEVTWEDLLKTSVYKTAANPNPRVFQLMLRAIQNTPPDNLTHMPLTGTLACDDLKTLSNWLQKCAPPVAAGTGNGACCASQSDPVDPAVCPKP